MAKEKKRKKRAVRRFPIDGQRTFGPASSVEEMKKQMFVEVDGELELTSTEDDSDESQTSNSESDDEAR